MACCGDCGPEQVKNLISIKVSEVSQTVDQTLNYNPVDAAAQKRKVARAEMRLERKGGGGGTHTEHVREFDLGPIDAHYELDPKWSKKDDYGTGLKRYLHKKTKMPRAVLCIRKAQIPQDTTKNEIIRQMETLCKIDHPNIVSFRECFEDSEHLRLVYDWCEGGPLVTKLSRYEDLLTEGHVAQIIREVLCALAAASNWGVHHCDLGLFNIFLAFNDRLSPIKVFGIGLAGYVIPPISSVHRKGSRTNKHFYASPEMYSGSFKRMTPKQRHLSDIWSVGALLFTICSGRPPFGLGSRSTVMEKVVAGNWEFGLEFSQYSKALLEFIETCLVTQWQKRISGDETLRMAWLGKSQSLHVNKDGKISNVALQQLNSFVAQDHIIQTLARLLTDIGISADLYPQLDAQFRELDLNGDGTITLGELTEVASTIPGMTDDGMNAIIAKLDRNGNCNVDITEFIAALVMEQEEADEQLIKKAFSKMDRNGDARVTKKELFSVLRQYSNTVDVHEVSQFVAHTDNDGDKKMDYREFCHLFPQVSNKHHEIQKRMTDARTYIECGPDALKEFMKATEAWLHKLYHKRDQIEIGAEVQALPNSSNSAHYSYVKGHFSEWEVQTMILDTIDYLQNIPGYQLTKEMKRVRKLKEMEKKRRKDTSDSSILGIKTVTRTQALLKAEREAKELLEEASEGSSGTASDDESPTAKNNLATDEAAKRKDTESTTDRKGSDGTSERKESEMSVDRKESEKTDGEKSPKADGDDGPKSPSKRSSEKKRSQLGRAGHHHHHHGLPPGVEAWITRMTDDRKDRLCDPDYQVDLQVYENLWWLLKVKSETHWVEPLREIVTEMRESCTEEVTEVVVERKADLARMIQAMNDQYIMKDGCEVGEAENRVKLKKTTRLIPLGVMKGKNLKLSIHLEKMEETKLPATFVFACAKGDVTHQKVELMQYHHTLGMKAAGKHITWMVESIKALFEEVREDLKICGSLEGTMMHPPNLSQLYLPFCEGREVLDDAATPRSDENDCSTDESMSPRSQGGETPTRASKKLVIDQRTGESKPVVKMERNHVLSMAANKRFDASKKDA